MQACCAKSARLAGSPQFVAYSGLHIRLVPQSQSLRAFRLELVQISNDYAEVVAALGQAHQPVFIVNGDLEIRMTPRKARDHMPEKVGPKRYGRDHPQPTAQPVGALGKPFSRFVDRLDQWNNPLVQ